MTGFRGRDDTGRVVEDLTPETLRRLLDGAAHTVVVENPGWGDGYSARAEHREGTEAWRIEVAGGGPDPCVWADAPSRAATFDILRSWAAADGWWQEAFTWTPCAPDPSTATG